MLNEEGAIQKLKEEAAAQIQQALKQERKHQVLQERLQGILEDNAGKLAELYREELKELRNIIDEKPGKMVGNSGEMREVYKQVKKCSRNDAPALIYGNDGTGKELTARTIAELSARKDKPFVIVSCANMNDSPTGNQWESELFGYERGAFIGANSRHLGKAEIANGGTLFLDDVSALDLRNQERLLRFMQDQTFSRLGSNIQQRSDVRLIAASSRNLESLMQQKLFREDLFYRLNIVQITLPDLAQRKSDILLLAEYFISQVNLKYGTHVVRLSTPAIDMLMSYHWPGNVQELENCIERAALATNDDCIHSHNLPPTLQTDESARRPLLPGKKAPLATLMDTYEREILSEALKRNGGNMSAAARDLSISPRVMHYKMTRLNMQKGD